MSLEKQLEHIEDEIDGAKVKLAKLRVIVASAKLEGKPITYNELGEYRDLLRHAGGSLNHAIRVITAIMTDTGDVYEPPKPLGQEMKKVMDDARKELELL